METGWDLKLLLLLLTQAWPVFWSRLCQLRTASLLDLGWDWTYLHITVGWLVPTVKPNSSFEVGVGPSAFAGRRVLKEGDWSKTMVATGYGLWAIHVRMQDHEFCETIQTHHQIEWTVTHVSIASSWGCVIRALPSWCNRFESPLSWLVRNLVTVQQS
jgi:hypothetical protein